MAATSFWGLKLSKGLQFTKVAEKSFHISSATLDPSSTTEQDVLSVIFEKDDEEYILCNLCLKHGVLQVPLDLQFSEGDNITFSLRGGKGNVFLTGYNIFDDYETMMESDEEEDDEDEGEVETLSIPSPVKSKRKRKNIEDGSAKSPKVEAKRPKLENGKSQGDNSEGVESLSGSKKKQNKKKSNSQNDGSQKSEGSKSPNRSSASVKKPESGAEKLSALLANGDIEEDEEDDDFLIGEDDEGEGGEEVEDEDDDDDDEDGEEEEEEDDDEDDDDDDEEDESSTKKLPHIVHSPGKTPIVKGNQQKKVAVYYEGRLKNGKTFDKTVMGLRLNSD